MRKPVLQCSEKHKVMADPCFVCIGEESNLEKAKIILLVWHNIDII